MKADDAQSLDAVRAGINALDDQIVALIAHRQSFVEKAALFKADAKAVRDPARVDAVIERVRALGEQHGASPAVVEATYRAMIGAFINHEMIEHQQSQAGSVD